MTSRLDRAADEAAAAYARAKRGRRLYKLTLAQIARLRALQAGVRRKRAGGKGA